MRVEDKILNFLKVTGPSLPIRVAKNIKEDGLITSAYLSDLASQGKVKISKLKIGSSPLYYLPGHESQLATFTDGFNPKDVAVLNRLQDEKVIRESGQELLTKVALRNLKDFAIPLNVTSNQGTEIFWQYYLISSSQANETINRILEGKSTNLHAEQEVIQKKEPDDAIGDEEITKEKEQIHLKIHTTEPESITKEPSSQEQTYPPNTTIQDTIEERPIYPPNTVKEVTIPQVQQEPIHTEMKDDDESEVFEPSSKIEVVEKTQVDQQEQKDTTEFDPKTETQEKKKEREPKQEKQKSLVTKLKEKIVGKKKRPSDESFLPAIEKYFAELDIEIVEHEVVRKNSEMDFSLKIPSVVGRLHYYCKAKSKNRCDEKDLSAAYMQAQITKRPLLFLYTGALSKKAEEMLSTGAFENAIIKKIEYDGS